MSVYVIAEAGVNHNGRFDLACRLVDAAKAAGVDCIKFQTFKSEKLVSTNARKADYQKTTTGDGSQMDMLKKLELSFEEFLALKAYCDKVEITFLSTPFDSDSIEFLDSIDMPFWKIPSGEVTNLPYLVALAKTAAKYAEHESDTIIKAVQGKLNIEDVAKNAGGILAKLKSLFGK